MIEILSRRRRNWVRRPSGRHPARSAGFRTFCRARACFRTILVAVAASTIAWTALPAEEIPTASPEDVGMSSERLLEIDAVIKRHIDSGEIQGAVTAVARRGRVVHFEAYGLMDVERARPMEKDSIFRMASSSKPVLGVAAMMMIEEGLFDPADEVAKYLPEFADMQVAVLKEPADEDVSPAFAAPGQAPEHRLVPAKRRITIHDLLTHTSGLGSYGLGTAVAGLPELGRRTPWRPACRSTRACRSTFSRARSGATARASDTTWSPAS